VLRFALVDRCARYVRLRYASKNYVFLNAIVDMKDEYIYMPKNITELNRVSSCYGVAGLPGCCGSIDVVHVKWKNCPAGNFNRAKGKETFPSLGFECITDFNRSTFNIWSALWFPQRHGHCQN
jgi:hypothetical protein